MRERGGREIEIQRTQPSVRSRVLLTYHEFYISCFLVTHWNSGEIKIVRFFVFSWHSVIYAQSVDVFLWHTEISIKMLLCFLVTQWNTGEMRRCFFVTHWTNWKWNKMFLSKFSPSSPQVLSSFSTVSQQFLSKCSPTFRDKTCTEIPDFCARQPCSKFWALKEKLCFKV